MFRFLAQEKHAGRRGVWKQLPCFKLNLVDRLVPTSPCHLISFADTGNGHMSGGSLNMPCYEGDLSIGGAKTCVSSSMLITTALCAPRFLLYQAVNFSICNAFACLFGVLGNAHPRHCCMNFFVVLPFFE